MSEFNAATDNMDDLRLDDDSEFPPVSHKIE